VPIGWASPRSGRQRIALVELARAAAANRPQNPSLALALGVALGGAGLLADAVAALTDGCRRFPSNQSLHRELAEALSRTGDIEAALALARDWSGSPWGPHFAFKLLRRHGRLDEAVRFEAAVAASFPADPDLLEARAERVRTRPETLLKLAEEVLSVDPTAMHAVHYKAVALAQLGRDEEAAEMMGLDRFLSVATLQAGQGFESEESFRQSLAKEILGNPTLHPDPVGHASQGGLRTRNFPLESDRAAPALIAAIRGAVSDYADSLRGHHPFIESRPERATFSPWALVFPAGGRQRLHQHPGRWLTGIFYVSVPEDGSGRRAPSPGAIRIGGLPDWAGVEPPWPVLTIAPKPGMLLLFPSSVPHETVPNGAAGERISVAFDVAAES
jgi:catechol 2,3-dioxygenase-like lactoylglutathione lyase family enzyme